jgi:hypothetical protein
MWVMVVGIFWLVVLNFSLSAQVSPVPVADMEVRDSTSTRMRSLEMERAKKNASKSIQGQISAEAQNRFSRIRDDFEAIQKLQLSIVEAYVTGRVVNYGRIREAASEMKKRAARLSVDFFNTNAETDLDDVEQARLSASKNVRDALVELDTAVGNFVASPIFQKVVVDSRQLEKAQLELRKIIVLSRRLLQLAESPK